MDYLQHLSSRPYGELIHRHTHANLIDMGALVAVPEATAAEAGIAMPVTLTRAAWEGCVAWTDADTARTGAIQDEAGRAVGCAVDDRDRDPSRPGLRQAPRAGER